MDTVCLIEHAHANSRGHATRLRGHAIRDARAYGERTVGRVRRRWRGSDSIRAMRVSIWSLIPRGTRLFRRIVGDRSAGPRIGAGEGGR